MFRGADSGYARMSVAKPDDLKTPNMTPGMGVKLLRNGADSANFVCMFSVDGQDSLNFFANDFSNHIPDFTSLSLKPLAARFATQTDYIQTIALSEMASMAQDGKSESPVFPWSMRFVPQVGQNFPGSVAEGYTDFKADLSTIKSGSTLYDVYALDKPTELGGKEQKIAEVRTKSEMTTSLWGDDHFYIRHQKMEEDFVFRPEWEPYAPKYGGIFLGLEQGEESSCPFANLLQYLQ